MCVARVKVELVPHPGLVSRRPDRPDMPFRETVDFRGGNPSIATGLAQVSGFSAG